MNRVDNTRKTEMGSVNTCSGIIASIIAPRKALTVIVAKVINMNPGKFIGKGSPNAKKIINPPRGKFIVKLNIIEDDIFPIYVYS